MLSLRARLFLWILRNRHLIPGRQKETGEDWEYRLEAVRASAAKSAAMLGKLPKKIEAVPAQLPEVQAEWIQPAGYKGSKTILYFRGGGYVLGSISAHRNIVAKFVRATGIRALLFEYRLAPEHPYPAALQDACNAYDGLLKSDVTPEDIVFVGDSAGAGLCLATLLALKDQGKSLPRAAALLSPWTDVACTGDSITENAQRCLSPLRAWKACQKHYVGNNDPTMPYISPLYGDLTGLPPLFIVAGEYETLRDDSIRFAEKATRAGVNVTLEIGKQMCHCYPACAPLFPEATRSLHALCQWLRTHIDRNDQRHIHAA